MLDGLQGKLKFWMVPREGDEIAIEVTEQRPRKAGAGKGFPSIQDLKASEGVLSEPEQPIEIQKDKRKIILD